MPIVKDRMRESLVLFEAVVNSRWFLRTSFILYLTKLDVLKKKLPKVRIPSFHQHRGHMPTIGMIDPQVPLENYYPDYTGGNDVNKAARYILWRFLQVNRAQHSVYPQYALLTSLSL